MIRSRSPGWELHGEQEEGIFPAVMESAAVCRWVSGLSLPGHGEGLSESCFREVGTMGRMMETSRAEVLLTRLFSVIPSCPAFWVLCSSACTQVPAFGLWGFCSCLDFDLAGGFGLSLSVVCICHRVQKGQQSCFPQDISAGKVSCGSQLRAPIGKMSAGTKRASC